MAASRVGVVSAEEKQLLLERYLDVVWIDDVTDIKCVRCGRVPIHHYVSNCQHLYCRNCRTVYSDGGHWRCPKCQEYVTELSDQEWQLEDTIYQLRAHCPNMKYGCPYQGQLKTIPGHLRRCADTREATLPAEIRKPTVDTVADQIRRLNEIVGAMRSEAREKSERAETMEVTMGQLDNRIKVLTLSLEQTLKESDEQLRTQLQQQHTLMTTQYEEVMRRLMSVELQLQILMDGRGEADKHTQLMVNTCQVNVHGVQLMMATTQMPHDELHSMTLLYQWHIMDIKTTDGKWDDTRESEVFALTGYDCGAKARINTDGRILLQLIDFKANKTPIDTRSMPKLSWVIESQSQTTQDKQQLTQQHSTHAIRTRLILFIESLDYGKDLYSGWYISSFLDPPYVVSNGMKLKLYIEPPSMARSFFSNKGILLWRLDNYKVRKQMEVDGLIWRHESPYFYTSPHGYRVFIRLGLSGENVFGRLLFVKGEHDSSLTQLFPHRLTVTLFNHADQSKNLVISQEGNKAYYTLFEFKTASASLLERGGYVADDSVLIKVVVVAS